MMSGVLSLLAFVSVIAFPWPYTVGLALLAGFKEPYVPLAVGLLADALYFLPGVHAYPRYTMAGAITTGLILMVRSRLRAGIIE